MISIIGCLLGATNVADYGKYKSMAATSHLIVSPDRQPIVDLGSMTAVQCRENMTTKGECINFNVGTFVTQDSKTEYRVCFKPDPSFRTILNADEDIRLIKLSGKYFIMGEAIHACDDGKGNIRQASFVEVVDCNSG